MKCDSIERNKVHRPINQAKEEKRGLQYTEKASEVCRTITIAQHTERGEALKATGLEAARRLSLFIYRAGSVPASGGPVSRQLRASNEGLPRPRVARARRETGPPAVPSARVVQPVYFVIW